MHSAIIAMPLTLSLRRILVATDLSATSAPLAPIAVALAKRFDSELVFAHVVPAQQMPTEAAAFTPDMTEEAAKRRMAELLRSTAVQELNVHGRLRAGDAAEQIAALATSESFDLVITGTHGRLGFRHFLIGSVCEEIFRRVRCPVLTVGPHVPNIQEPTAIRKVLFPTDLSPESLGALPYACSIASEFDAQVLLLHVLPRETSANPETRELTKPLQARMKELADPIICPSCRPEYLIESGSEAETIQAVAREQGAGLIVLGVRHGSPAASLQSTIAYKTVADAHCPVLTVRTH